MVYPDTEVMVQSPVRARTPRAAKGRIGIMEILVALAGLAGVALLLQSKALPSESDFKKANDKLAANPTDPDANTVVGKYTAFVLGDYSAAMPYLVHSKNKTLKTLAEHELDPAYTDSAPKKIGMGDEWVSAAKEFKPLYRILYNRATQWYAAAWPELDGVWKDKVRERFRKMLLLPGPGTTKQGLPAGWTAGLPNPKVVVDGTVAHGGGRSLRVEIARDKPLEQFWTTSPLMPPPTGPVVFSAWVASDGNTDGALDRVSLEYYLSDGSRVEGQLFIPIDRPYWTRVETKLDIPKDATRFKVGLLLSSTRGTIWADEFSLKDAAGKEYVDNGSFER